MNKSKPKLENMSFSNNCFQRIWKNSDTNYRAGNRPRPTWSDLCRDDSDQSVNVWAGLCS